MKKLVIVRLTGVLLLGLIIIYLSCQKDSAKIENERVVASIDDFEITYGQFTERFNRLHPARKLSKASDSLKKSVLDDMINQQLTLFEAYRLEYDKSSKAIEMFDRKERSLAAEALEKREIKDKIITEDVIRQYYQWSDRELKLLRMKFKCGTDNIQKEEKEQKAWDIYERLMQGEEFKVLAARFSEHKNAKQDSGRLGTVSCFDVTEDIFSHVYELSAGQISKPYYSNNAYFILMVDKVKKLELRSFEEERANLDAKLQKYFGIALAHQFNIFRKNLMAEFHYQLNPEQIQFFCKRCGTMKTREDSADLFNDDEKSLVLSKTDIDEITIGEFFPKVFRYYWNSLNQKRVVEMLLLNINYDRIKKQRALAEGLHKLPQVVEKLDRWKISYLKPYVLHKEVIEKIDTSDEVLRPIYNREKYRLKLGERRTVREIFQITEAGINKVYKLAISGQDFPALEKKYQQNKETRTHGILGPFRKGPNGKLGELAFSMKVGEISKPFKYRGGYSIIKLLSIEPERIKSFDEVREQLKSEYIENHKSKLISEWYTKIAKNYNIKKRNI